MFFLLVLILLLMPTRNFFPVWFALSLLRFRLPARLHIMFFFFFQAEDGIRDVAVTGVQTCCSSDLAAIRPFGSLTVALSIVEGRRAHGTPERCRRAATTAGIGSCRRH